MPRILIAIQARSTSTRLPNKISLNLVNGTVLSNVIAACESTGLGIVAVLAPAGDKLKTSVPIIYGSENDVLSRYVLAMEQHSPDYIVRITSDCPLVSYSEIVLITNGAVSGGFDYLSNSDTEYRTAMDGCDIEVLSARALDYLNKNALGEKDREHVTTYIKRENPKELRVGHALSRIDLSHLKFSVDTVEDFLRIRENDEKVMKKIEGAKIKYGKESVFLY